MYMYNALTLLYVSIYVHVYIYMCTCKIIPVYTILGLFCVMYTGSHHLQYRHRIPLWLGYYHEIMPIRNRMPEGSAEGPLLCKVSEVIPPTFYTYRSALP